jgi:hypothetical protein
MTIERKAVQSSNVKSVGYDPGAEILEVQFISGGIYRYSGVCPEKYEALMAAPSVGSFIQRHIKQHACVRVEDEPCGKPNGD